MKNTLQTKNISTIAFWDINPQDLDLEKDSLMIISRVFNYGKWSDIKAVLNYYGKERIKQEIVHASWLKKSVITFLCLIFKLEEKDFTDLNNKKNTIWNWR